MQNPSLKRVYSKLCEVGAVNVIYENENIYGTFPYIVYSVA